MGNKSYLKDLFGLVEFAKLTGKETPAELLAIDRYVRFTEAMRGLRLDPKQVRNNMNLERRAGVDIDEKYGIYRQGGKRPHLFIKPKQFAKHLDAFKTYQIKTPFKRLPAKLSEEQFLQLSGIYKLSDILRTGFVPLDRNRVFRARRETPPEACGLWKEGGLILCRIETFLPWAISEMRGIPVEEAQRALAKIKERLARDKAQGRKRSD